MAQLVATDGYPKGKRFPLEGETILGRSFESEIQIHDVMATRRHCSIRETKEGYLIEDLGSRNGTRVTGQIISKPTLLQDGDVLTLPGASFRFELQDDTASMVTLLETHDTESSIVSSRAMDATVADGKAATDSEHRQTLESLAKAHHRLHTVVEIGNAVSAHAHIDDLLQEIIDRLFQVFPQMERGFVMLREGGAEMDVKVARHRDKSTLEEIAVSKHIIEEAASHRMAVLSADAMVDDRFASAGSVMDFRIRSMMCAPLIVGDDILGVIHVDTTRQDQRFSEDDLDLFTGITNQTAVAIAYARMHATMRDRQRHEYDMALAEQMQHSFLPGDLPKLDGYAFSASYKAALEVGGDFYDFIPLLDGRLAIIVGDVMGKGVSAALMMVRMMSDIRYLAMTEPDAASVLACLNDSLFHRGIDNAFVTIALVILDPATREVTFANAAHCPPLLRRSGSCALIELGAEGGFAIGTVPESEYTQETITLAPGDSLVLYTDGVTEAVSETDEMYGDGRLTSCIARAPSASPDLMAAVLADVATHVGKAPQSDDLTLVCISVDTESDE
jgi:phosphoserine phosphatase RsbU/P